VTFGGHGFLHADAQWSIGQLSLYDAVYVGASWRGSIGWYVEASHLYQP
jgi:hypothetical protein